MKTRKKLQLARKPKSKRMKNSEDDVTESRFPLLRLPILAIQNCIRIFTVFQFLDFSLLSKRAKFLASTIRRDKIGIDFYIAEEPRVVLTLPNFPNIEWFIEFEMDMTILKKLVPRRINGTTMLSTVRTNTANEFKEKKKFHRLILPTENILKTMEWMTEHLCVTFHSPIRLMYIKHFQDPFIHFFEWLHTLQKTIDLIIIYGNEISTKSLLFILDNFEVKKELSLFLGLLDNSFRYSKSINTHTLNIRFPQWSLSNILCSENSMIALSNSCLTPEDINCLLKHWIGGWNKNLFYLELVRTVENVEVNAEVFRIIAEGIEWREHSKDSGRPMHTTYHNGAIRPMYDGRHVEIERSDGRIAAFAQIHQFRNGKVLHHFRFQAWNKK